MNEFYLSRKISARLSLRAAARMFCILALALWGAGNGRSASADTVA